MKNKKYLIVGGTSKAGTTSIFHYLKDHPAVCVSAIKEARFFLDEGYPVPVKKQFNENLEGYADFFEECGDLHGKVLVEATPDYLYSENALRIGDLLPHARIVFVIRDPVERMVSWFKYARQRGLIPESMDFSEYAAFQFDNPVRADTPVHFRALEQGRYSQFISRFESLMPGRVLTLSYDGLVSETLQAMKDICAFSGIDPVFYENYVFHVKNKSQKVSWPVIEKAHKKIRRHVAFRVVSYPTLMKVFRLVHKPIKKVMQLNYSNYGEELIIPDSVRDRLGNYYANDLVYYREIMELEYARGYKRVCV